MKLSAVAVNHRKSAREPFDFIVDPLESELLNAPCLHISNSSVKTLSGTVKMNDSTIRRCFHCQVLSIDHACPKTLVIDELGLNHGECRADIAVINGKLSGYEIKSNFDSLVRLKSQIRAYDAVFQTASIVIAPRHLRNVLRAVPVHWGIYICLPSADNGLTFWRARRESENTCPDPVAIARLLWRDEAAQILRSHGASGRLLKRPRAELYNQLADILDLSELRTQVIGALKNRKSWRHPAPPFRCDD